MGSFLEVRKTIGLNLPKVWKFFEVAHSTLSTLDNSLGHLRSVSELTTLIADVELQRGDSTKGDEMRTCLHLADCADR